MNRNCNHCGEELWACGCGGHCYSEKEHKEWILEHGKRIKTKWSKEKIPLCLKGNHKWKDSSETGICLKCGYDVFDRCYKQVEETKQ